jgi:hypothetical protein
LGRVSACDELIADEQGSRVLGAKCEIERTFGDEETGRGTVDRAPRRTALYARLCLANEQHALVFGAATSRERG